MPAWKSIFDILITKLDSSNIKNKISQVLNLNIGH